MKRPVLVVLLALVVSLLVAAPAGATTETKKKRPTTCDLLSKKQASKILGHKVVKTVVRSDRKSGAEQCEYRTNYYLKRRFENLGAPYKLLLTTQPLAGIESEVHTLETDPDSEAVDGLGDRAFTTKGHDLSVLVGDLVLQAKVTNVEWSGNELDTLILTPEREVMDRVVPVFESTSS
jgi:hypothetical protein